MNIKSNLKDNTWQEIIWASENNCIPDTWKVGDEIDLKLDGHFNEVVTLQIWDFNRFDKSDGSGKAGICFGMKNLMKDREYMNSFYLNTGGWNESYMRNTVMKNIYESMPTELRNAIKEVRTEANMGGASSAPQSCTDKVFLPGFKELGFTYENYDGNQVKFPIFSDINSRIKKLNNGTGSAEWWWTRSPDYNYSSYFRGVGSDGGYYYYYVNYPGGVCVCFNI